MMFALIGHVIIVAVVIVLAFGVLAGIGLARRP